ncbi:hypothetical protein V8C35DRAFT_36845 [Trichoderma chlorosporum]
MRATSPKDAPAASPKPPPVSFTNPQLIEELGEAETVYSDQSSVGARISMAHVSWFTTFVYQQIRPLLTEETAEKAMDLLPELLRGFALKVGCSSQAQVNQSIKYDVHKHRHTIIQSLEALYENDQAMATERQADKSYTPIVDQLNPTWSGVPLTDNMNNPVEELNSFAWADEEINSPQYFSQHYEATTASSAFQWVIEKLRELDQFSTDQSAKQEISSCIIDGLNCNRHISKRHPPKPTKGIFEITCDIFGYVKDQGYTKHAADVLPRAVTVTGSNPDVQALTIEQYLKQTWPTIGCRLLQTIQNALRVCRASKPFVNSSKYIFPEDGTHVEVSIGEATFKVEVVGTPHSIADIAEQLGWLATTLAPSPKRGYTPYCHPEIKSFKAKDVEEGFENIFFCRISVATEQVMPNMPDVVGLCWHRLFNNPVLVTGYPTKARRDFDAGPALELRFDAMITLSDCRYAVTWDGKFIMKGFFGILIPTQVHPNVIIWHLHVNKYGEPMEYSDPRIHQAVSITPEMIENSRHFLGWVANAQNIIGYPSANYDIGWSGLDEAEKHRPLRPIKLSLTAGNLIAASTDLEKGNRDVLTSAYFPNSGYRYLVNYIGQQFVLLFDVKEARAFLSDGYRALLHLVRASLENDQREFENEYYAEQIDKLNIVLASKQGARGAMEVLFTAEDLEGNDKNTGSMFEGFKHRVERVGKLLQIAISRMHQAINENTTSRRILRNMLDGFDFMDVVVGRDLRLHTVTLPIEDSGHGWVDLVHSIPAITLFGTDFGDLIKPDVNISATTCKECGLEATLPSGKHLMAVGVDVLQKILNMCGSKDASTHPRRLINDQYWYSPGPVFEPCQCSTSSDGLWNHNDRVQRLTKGKILCIGSDDPVKLEKHGAVIFGHSGKMVITRTKRSTPKANSACSPSSDGLLLISNESTGSDKSLLSDISSSVTPNSAMSPRADEIDSDTTTIERQSHASHSVSTEPIITATTPQATSVVLPIASRKRTLGGITGIYERALKKTKIWK